MIFRFRALVLTRRIDHNDSKRWLQLFELTDNFVSRAIAQTCVPNYAIQRRKILDRFNRLYSAIRSDGVEFRHLDDQFATGNVLGELPVYDKKARPERKCFIQHGRAV